MNNIFSTFLIGFFLFSNTLLLAQQSPFIGLVLEEIPNVGFTNGEVTYRLYAELNSGIVTQIFGDETHPHSVVTTTTFFNQDLFGAHSNLQSEVNDGAFVMIPALEYDTWVALGDSYTEAPNIIGDVGFGDNLSGSSWTFGGILDSDAAIFRLSDDPLCIPDANGRVLLGQFTTNGVISGFINLAGEEQDGITAWEELQIPIPQMQTSISGCTDILASNYNPIATIDDGSCIYCETLSVEANGLIIDNDENGTPYHISCFGFADGEAVVTNGGGVPPYTFSWSPSGGVDSAETGMSAGLNTVTVTDANGCTQSATITLVEPNYLDPNILESYYSTSTDGTTNEISCYSFSDGWIESQTLGGVPSNVGFQYLWVNDNTGSVVSTQSIAENLTANTSYTVTVTDANGCVSTETSEVLDEPPPLVLNNTINGCDSVLIGSNYYTISGAYTDTLTSVNGCDSVVNTNLTIGQNTSSYDTLSVGASIVWNGMPLNVSGDYSVTLINSVGCDSIVNLNLTVTTTGISEIANNKSNLVKITDMLGQETPYRRNTPLLYIYDDGIVEKRIVIE